MNYQIGKQKITEDKLRKMSGNDANALYYATHQGNKQANTMFTNPGSYVDTGEQEKATKEDYENVLRQIKQIHKNMNEPKREIPKLERPTDKGKYAVKAEIRDNDYTANKLAVKDELRRQNENQIKQLDYYTRKDLEEERSNLWDKGVDMTDLESKRLKEVNSLLDKDDKARSLSNSNKPSTRYSNQNAGNSKDYSSRDTRFDKDFEDFYEWRYNRADTTDYDKVTDTNIPHWENVKKDIMKKNNWDEKTFNKYWEQYDKMRTQQMADEEVNTTAKFAKNHPVLGTLAQTLYNPQTALEGAETVLDNTLGKFNPELVPDSADSTRFTGTRVKEATKQAVKDNIDNEVLKRGYDTVTGLLDMGVNVALSGGNPLMMGLLSGGQSATRNQMMALERGADADKAAQFGTATGAVSGVLNSIGLDKALGATAKTIGGSIAKGALTEGLENVAEDAATLGLDVAINKYRSQLENLHNYYTSKNLSDSDAWLQVAKDTGLDMLTSFGSGALLGGLMRGVKSVPTLVNDYKAKAAQSPNNTSNAKTSIIDPAEKALADPDLYSKHTQAEIDDMQRYVDSTDENLLNYIDSARNSKYVKPYKLRDISLRMANDLKAATGLGNAKKLTLDQSIIRDHINPRHGKNGNADHTMADDHTLARIQYILDNYDDVYKGKGNSYLRMKDKTSAPTAVFTKKVDDHYVVAVVEADSTDTAKVITAYIANENGINDDIKKGKLTRLSHSANSTLPRTPVANSLSSSFGSNVSQNGGVVNSQPNGIQVYRGFNNSNNPLESNLVREQTIEDVLGRGKAYEEDSLPLQYFTESEDIAKGYANQNAEYLKTLEEDARKEYRQLTMEGKKPQMSEDEYASQRAIEKYRTLTGNDYTSNGRIESQQINPTKPLDLSELGEQSSVEDIYNYLSNKTGKSVSDIDDALMLNDLSLDGEPVNVYRLLRNEGNGRVGRRFYDFLKANGYDAVRYAEQGTNQWALLGETPTQAKIGQNTKPNNKIDFDLQFFAEKKANLEAQLNNPNLSDADRARIRSELAEVNELIAQMDENFYRLSPQEGQKKVSKTVANADMRMDAERAAEELSKDIGSYFVQTEQMSYSKGRDKVVDDYEGSLNRYMNNEGDMYDGSDYDAIRILEQDIKSKRKKAEAEGNTELANHYREQLDKLAITRQLRSTSSGQFNQAAAKWIRTAEGAIDTAKGLADKALDMMEHGNKTQQSEARYIRETADDIMDYANEILSSENLWAELENADRRLKFEHELYQKIQQIGKEKGIEINDDLANKLANDLLNGQKNAEALARSIATFREYNFLGFDDEFLDKVEAIFDEAEQYDYNSKQRVELEEKAFEMLAKEIYKTGGDPQEKFDAWRYFAMLANTKTHERNVLGNLVFADMVHSSSNGISALMEGVTDKSVRGLQRLTKRQETGIKRTKAFINPASESDQSLISNSWKDAEQGAYRELAGNKYQNDVGNGIESYKPAFSTLSKGGQAVNKAIDTNNAILSTEDFFFKRQKYAGQLASYLKANGEDASIFEVEGKIKDLMTKKANNGLTSDEKTELGELRKRENTLAKARAYAIKQANYATFNQANETAGILSKHSKEWRNSKNPVARFFGREIESLAAFKNTPANIVKAMWDYSPVSLARGVGKTAQAIASKDATRNSKIGSAEVNEALDMLSKGLVGTAIMALGAKLYKDGILTSSKDDVRGKADEAEGKQSYALNINGKSYAIDALAPTATALFIGAEVYKLWEEHHGDGEDDKFFSKDGIFNAEGINDVVNSTLAVADPFIEQSMLQGAANTLESIRYAQTPGEAMMAALVTPQIGYFTQALPTAGGQIARTIDNTRRSLRTNSEGVAGAFERAGRQALNKIPFVNKVNNPYVDMYGRQQENYDGNILQRLGYQTLAPFYKQDINVEPYQAELDRLYDIDPENYADVLGESFPNKIDGRRLTNEEWTKGQTKAGEAWKNLINTSIKNSEYKSLTSEEQYEVQKSLQNLAEKIGTKEVLPDKKINNDLLSAFNGSNYGEVVNMAIADAKGKVTNAKVKEAGLPVNEVTKTFINNNDVKGQQKYKKALDVAKNYGYDSLTEKEYQIYDKKGGVALSNHLKSKKEAEYYGVPNTDDFQKALANGTAKTYAQTYKAVTSTKTGEDDLGNDKFLEYSDTTAQIYKDLGQQGLNNYARVKSNMGDKDSDAEYIKAMDKSKLSPKDKAYYFVLHKGKDVAKNAPKDTKEHTYMWYLAKQKYDSDGNGRISKAEKSALYSDVVPYLKSLGYSDTEARLATKWEYK